jgi:hypothetical protein
VANSPWLPTGGGRCGFHPGVDWMNVA